MLYVLCELYMCFHKVSYRDMHLVTIFTHARNVLVSFILLRFQKTSLAVETEVHRDVCGLPFAETFSNVLLCWGERVRVDRAISLISVATVTSFDIVQRELWLQSYLIPASENDNDNNNNYNNYNNNNKIVSSHHRPPPLSPQLCSPTIRVLPRLFILRCPISFSRLHFQQKQTLLRLLFY